MSKAKKILLFSLSGVLALGVIASGGSYWFVRHSLAKTDGELILGVSKPVSIVRDDYGIPHIYASNERDLMFAQGYVHAQDRLWQMELARRSVSGTLAEVFGEALLPRDRFNRTIGFKRMADQLVAKLDERTKEALQSYADGVNAFRETGPLPIEYTLTGAPFEPWQINDSIAVGKNMAWYLGDNAITELFMASSLKKLGVEKTESLVPGVKLVEGGTVSLKDGDARKLADLMHASRRYGIPGEGLGSNNWVVAGSKSATGKPLLANDMHLQLGAPSIFYQNHLSVSGQYSVTGVIFPGLPGVVAGHNEHIAWGFTNLNPDVQDLYMEKPNPNNPHQFEYAGRYEDATVIKETFRVKGRAEPVRGETVITRHGPIITDIVKEIGLSEQSDQPLALRWTAYDTGHGNEITAWLMMNKAKNRDEFELAMRQFAAPAQNIVYADDQGNIGWRANGRIPIRSKGNGMQPVPGWTDEYEWKSYIPWEELPHAWNPPEGYIATANNRVVDDKYPHFITYNWSESYRADRIQEMLREKAKLTLQDMQRMQGDWKNLQAVQYRDIWLPILKRGSWNAAQQQALHTLEEWMRDHPVDAPDLVGPSIFHITLDKTMQKLFEPQLGPDLYADFQTTGLSLTSVNELFTGKNKKWLEGTGGTVEQALLDGFEEALRLLKQQFGDRQEKWLWGAMHTVTFEHPLGAIKPLNLMLNDGPHPYGGSNVTVGAASFSRKQWPYKVVAGAPWRFTADLSNINASEEIMIMGASGQLGSAHYADQTSMWLAGRYKTMYFDEADVTAHTKGTLVLRPR
ncbi:penicillin acylase family protein [Paenibacillus sp. MZ04-78.2]|uniref:penicillin acylase family protein n=1 Tax=Paenibacillus sp. MZ04-78.2 TaxID=2962034 RepID=UPI0020B89F6D|nr:penicillin acylase family protein [Paenibacillus sp. MZ04-78.2]MCP3775600.1 penicillin acylase family protein [Paenibacillus sp. MZ04-78.2]